MTVYIDITNYEIKFCCVVVFGSTADNKSHTVFKDNCLLSQYQLSRKLRCYPSVGLLCSITVESNHSVVVCPQYAAGQVRDRAAVHLRGQGERAAKQRRRQRE